MARVLLGDFGAIARLGLREFLEEDGVDIVAEDSKSENVLQRLNEARPDVVVVDLDDEGGLEVASRIASAYPAVKVIACSSEKPMMVVFPAFHHGEFFDSDLSPELLMEAIRK
ncbi:MAG: response regulator [Actinomycetota bacterium]|nr:response regulator [Actinomycetota bacterium]